MTTAGSSLPLALDDVVAYVDSIRESPERREEMVDLLADDCPVYVGRSSNVVERIRAYAMAALGSIGLPPAALPYVLEELETGRNPYSVAAAGAALRGCTAVPDEVVPLILSAIRRLQPTDTSVCFDSFSVAPEHTRSDTALTVLVRTLAQLGSGASSAVAELQAMAQERGSYAPRVRSEMQRSVTAITAANGASPCCSGTGTHAVAPAPRAPLCLDQELLDLRMQDQDGLRLTLGDALLGRPTALGFFYTRCGNPEKCSLTVAKLAALQRRLLEEGLAGGINIIGITYDPAFDLPGRIRTYGEDRGLVFDTRCRFLRTARTFEPLRKGLQLGVSFGPATVNRHRLDFFVLDSVGQVVLAHRRRLWSEDEVLDALKSTA